MVCEVAAEEAGKDLEPKVARQPEMVPLDVPRRKHVEFKMHHGSNKLIKESPGTRKQRQHCHHNPVLGWNALIQSKIRTERISVQKHPCHRHSAGPHENNTPHPLETKENINLNGSRNQHTLWQDSIKRLGMHPVNWIQNSVLDTVIYFLSEIGPKASESQNGSAL